MVLSTVTEYEVATLISHLKAKMSSDVHGMYVWNVLKPLHAPLTY